MAIETDDATSASAPKGHEVTIIFNKKPVVVIGPRLNGAAIKAAGIAQGLPITPSFTLSELRGKRFENVADDEIVTVTKNSVFMATDDDDDS
jgi:hypothetical protein